MRSSARKRPIAAQSLCVLLATLALAGCGKSEEVTGQKVEMRDMEAVDGTISDAMTDLDAVRVDGSALASNAAGNASQAPARRAPRRDIDEAAPDAETVAAE